MIKESFKMKELVDKYITKLQKINFTPGFKSFVLELLIIFHLVNLVQYNYNNLRFNSLLTTDLSFSLPVIELVREIAFKKGEAKEYDDFTEKIKIKCTFYLNHFNHTTFKQLCDSLNECEIKEIVDSLNSIASFRAPPIYNS